MLTLPKRQKPATGPGTFRAITALLLREMSTTYGRSPGGYLWAVLEPAAGIALLAVVFSMMFRAPPLGTDFAMFYATGFLPFLLYSEVSTKVAQSIRFSRPLLFYPSVTFTDALFARAILNFLTQIVVFFLVITGISLMFETHVQPNIPIIIQSLLMSGLLGFGIGVFNCFLFSIAPLWERIWGVLNRPLFILSGILYTFESVPAIYRDALWYNPLIHVTALMRQGFYPTYRPDFISGGYVVAISLICLAAGLLFLGSYHRRILNF
jgi:capsular polysaccharide transport system permease protein